MTRSRQLSSAGIGLVLSALLLAPAVGAQTREGIKVRGHWVIEVRNPDGALVKRVEFDNSLAPGGGPRLAQYLAGAGVPARWVVELGVYGGTTSPCNGGTFNGSPLNHCYIVDSAASPMPTGTAVFPTLTAAAGGANSDQLVLTGNATALVTGEIVYVATRQSACVNTTAPASCNGAGINQQFTVHDLVNAQGAPTPLTIAAGQIVQVTVTLSFS
jgi:hypothetical protein